MGGQALPASVQEIHQGRCGADIRLGRQREEALLDLGRQAEAADESAEVVAGDPAPAGELLETLVGVVHAFDALRREGAHGRLHRLAKAPQLASRSAAMAAGTAS